MINAQTEEKEEKRMSAKNMDRQDRYLLPTICFTESGSVISYSFQELIPS